MEKYILITYGFVWLFVLHSTTFFHYGKFEGGFSFQFRARRKDYAAIKRQGKPWPRATSNSFSSAFRSIIHLYRAIKNCVIGVARSSVFVQRKKRAFHQLRDIQFFKTLCVNC